MTDAASLLPGLRPASFKGVTFWIADAQQPVGRRVLATYFPGTDIKVHDDFGIFDGPFRISGLVVGDDYVAQAEALRAAFQSPGPGTFVHPWLGPKQCVVFRPAEISFATDELRVARIEVEFDPVSATGSFGASLGRVLGLIGLVGPVARSLGSLGLVAGSLTALSWSTALASAMTVIDLTARLTTAAAPPGWGSVVTATAREALGTVQALPSSATAASAAIAAMAGHAEAAGLIWRAAPQPAIAPAAGAEAAPAVPDSRRGASTLLGIAAEAAATPAPFLSSQAVLASAELLVLGEAAATVLDIPFTSRQEALGWLARTDAGLAGLGQRLMLIARSRPALASPALNLVTDLRAALAEDINEVAGRLPGVTVITVGTPVPAIMIAQHLVGDDPSRIEAMVRDIVARNRIRHPGRVSGRIEVLL